MDASDKSLLIKLGTGGSIDDFCSEMNFTREQFDEWWSKQLTARVPSTGPRCRPSGAFRRCRDTPGRVGHTSHLRRP